jgi:hypothetical protein
MNLYLPFADTAIIMDASAEKPGFIARKNRDTSINILNQMLWKKLERGGYER